MDMHSGTSATTCITSTLMSKPLVIFILLVVVPVQPICNKNFWSWFVYYTYPVLMDSQDHVLDSLGQCCYIFFEYGHQGFMVSYYDYIPGKAIMMRLPDHVVCPVPPFLCYCTCTLCWVGFGGKCSGLESCVVRCSISDMLPHLSSVAVQHHILTRMCLKIKRFILIIKFHTGIDFYEQFSFVKNCLV